MEPDFLDEMIAKRARANPEFSVLLDAVRAARAEQNAKLEAAGAGVPVSTDEELVEEIPSRSSKSS